MHRILNSHRAAPKQAIYDDQTGEVVGVVKGRPTGSIVRHAEPLIAVYEELGDIVVQIETERFPLSSSRLVYRHDLERGLTLFHVSFEGAERTLWYPAWWAELGLDPEEIRFQPERDEEEDILGWLYILRNVDERRAEMVAVWRAR
jgi:hypothetical protein